jgi:hypothetical protein
MSEGTIVEIGGKQFQPAKKGREQADQVVVAAQWLGTYGSKILAEVSDEDGQIQIGDVWELIDSISKAVTTDALIDLFVVVYGCPKSFANKHFDIGYLVEGLMILWDESPGIRQLVQRFFSSPDSTDTTEE